MTLSIPQVTVSQEKCRYYVFHIKYNKEILEDTEYP